MNTLHKLLGIAVSTVLLTGIAGCEQKPAQTAGKAIDRAVENTGDKISAAADAAKEQAAKAGEAIDDAAITTKVKSALLAEPNIRALQIDVQTSNGVVTLSGTVDSSANIDHAKQIAASVKGVTSVNTNLMVKAPA